MRAKEKPANWGVVNGEHRGEGGWEGGGEGEEGDLSIVCKVPQSSRLTWNGFRFTPVCILDVMERISFL